MDKLREPNNPRMTVEIWECWNEECSQHGNQGMGGDHMECIQCEEPMKKIFYDRRYAVPRESSAEGCTEIPDGTFSTEPRKGYFSASPPKDRELGPDDIYLWECKPCHGLAFSQQKCMDCGELMKPVVYRPAPAQNCNDCSAIIISKDWATRYDTALSALRTAREAIEHARNILNAWSITGWGDLDAALSAIDKVLK